MNGREREKQVQSQPSLVETGIRKFQLETGIRKKKKNRISFGLILSLCHFENLTYM